VALRLAALHKVPGCPIGVSVAVSPGEATSEEHKLEALVAGLGLYEQAGVDFIEMNESCPNTEDATSQAGFAARLGYVAEHFLAGRQRSLPVLVKLSCDTPTEQVPSLLRTLVRLGFDGVNFGNTSTAYARHRRQIATAERALYDYFVGTFGGGVSGRPLKASSLGLMRAASQHLAAEPPGREFNLVRTGGIEAAADLRASEATGVALNQWYSGYFEAFSKHGHGLYGELFQALEKLSAL
jgi:dihydroorotate dehydrogenase